MPTDPAAPTNPTPGDAQASAAADHWSRPLVERQLAMLGQLAEAGLNIALAIERQATGAEAAHEVVQGDVALAYGRVARAVRLTIALQSRLIGELRERETGSAAGADAGAEDLQDRIDDRKARVGRVVAQVIQAGCGEMDVRERLAGEACERLDDESLDVLDRPFGEVVAEICAELGLEPDWARLAHEAWAEDGMPDASFGSPLAVLAGREGEFIAKLPTGEAIHWLPRSGSP